MTPSYIFHIRLDEPDGKNTQKFVFEQKLAIQLQMKVSVEIVLVSRHENW